MSKVGYGSCTVDKTFGHTVHFNPIFLTKISRFPFFIVKNVVIKVLFIMIVFFKTFLCLAQGSRKKTFFFSTMQIEHNFSDINYLLVQEYLEVMRGAGFPIKAGTQII